MTISTIIVCQSNLPVLPLISAKIWTEAWINQETVTQFLNGLGIDETFLLNESAVLYMGADKSLA